MAFADVEDDGSVSNRLRPDGDTDGDAAYEAWQRLATDWTPRLRAYFGRLRCSRDERDELVLDVLTDAWALAAELSFADRDEAELIRALARQASARHKRLIRHETSLNSSADFEESTPLAATVSRDRMHLWFWLEQLLSRLPVRQRAAIERHIDGTSDSEIANEIGCGVASVRVLRARGMATLRRITPPPAMRDGRHSTGDWATTRVFGCTGRRISAEFVNVLAILVILEGRARTALRRPWRPSRCRSGNSYQGRT